MHFPMPPLSNFPVQESNQIFRSFISTFNSKKTKKTNTTNMFYFLCLPLYVCLSGLYPCNTIHCTPSPHYSVHPSNERILPSRTLSSRRPTAFSSFLKQLRYIFTSISEATITMQFFPLVSLRTGWRKSLFIYTCFYINGGFCCV